jgi:hypothetical protein
MDAVAIGREIDPNRTYWVIRPRPNLKRLVRVNSVELIVGVVSSKRRYSARNPKTVTLRKSVNAKASTQFSPSRSLGR